MNHMASRKFFQRPAVMLALALCSVGGLVTLMGRLATGPQLVQKRVQISAGEQSEAYPAISPDGKRLAYSARESSKVSAFHVFVRELPSGKALQLTNILRDVRTDAERGRIYLPQSELARFGVTEREILSFEYSDRFHELAKSVAARAKQFYRQARETLPAEDRRAMVAAGLMGTVYWRLLRKLERRQFNIFGPELTRLSKSQKLLLIFQSWFCFLSGANSHSYGTA